METQAADSSDEAAFFQLQVQRLCSVEVLVHGDVEPELLENTNIDFRASSFTPTNYHFNSPPEPGKTNSSNMKLFFHLVHKAKELGRKRMWKGEGGGPEGGGLKYWRGDKLEASSGCALSEFWRAPERAWSADEDSRADGHDSSSNPHDASWLTHW